MRGVTKLLVGTALALLLATGIAACGGGDSDDSTAGSATATTEQTAPSTTTEDNGSGQEPGDDSGGSDDSSSSEGSAEFGTPGNEESVATFGQESSDAEREEASEVVVTFLEARADGDWETVCANMASPVLDPLERLSERTPQFKGKDCAELFEALTEGTPESARESTIGDSIAVFRVDGDRGFALYHGTDEIDYFVPLLREDGVWKASTLSPNQFGG